MKWTLLTVGIAALALLQTSAIPAFELFGVAPNLLLVALACWVVVRGQEEAMILAPMAGIWIGLLSLQGMAESVAAFMPVVLVAALRDLLAPRSEYVWALAVVVATTMLYFIAIAVSIEMEGSSIDWMAATTDVLLPSVLVNLLTGLVGYWLIRLPTRRAI